jgi:putative PIN family toxin of toxin-antitoxin system
LVSFLISGKLNKFDEILLTPEIQLVFSEELITEFISVIQRPKLRSYFRGIDVDQLMSLLMQHGIIIHVTSAIQLCRDPKDNFLLALADDSRADYLITGDKDLLSLHSVNETLIITLMQFKKLNHPPRSIDK